MLAGFEPVGRRPVMPLEAATEYFQLPGHELCGIWYRAFDPVAWIRDPESPRLPAGLASGSAKTALPAVARVRGGILVRCGYPGLSATDAAAVANACSRHGLDPLRTRVYPCRERDGLGRTSVGVRVSIADLRALAARCPGFDGTGELRVVRWPGGAREVSVTAFRRVDGRRCEFVGTTSGPAGADRPLDDLAVWAEADALREAFPDEVGSLLCVEELYFDPIPLMHLVAGDDRP